MNSALPHRSERGFTLTELLVVIVIIVVLLALGIPLAGRAMESSHLAKCTSNLRQWGMGYQLYMNDHDGCFPQAAVVANNASTQWQELIAPYVVGSAGTQGSQRFVMREMFECPGNSMAGGIVYASTQYLNPTQYSRAPQKLVALQQKLSTYMLMTENYTGEVWDTRPWGGPGTNAGRVDYTRHTIGGKQVANFLFADFHVEALSYQETLNRPVVTIP